MVVFLVALPLCLGIALASNAPLFSGLLAGIVGGIIVGSISGSHTSVSGPAAGLTAVIAMQIETLKAFDVFLLAVVIAGALQIAMGVFQAGALADFVPTSVINGLLAAIGVILILKQTPHLFGHDKDPEGDLAFSQPDQETTFSELLRITDDIHLGASLVGISCLVLLLMWEKSKFMKKLLVPAPLVAVILGTLLAEWIRSWGEMWAITETHRVEVPVASSFGDLRSYLMPPNLSAWNRPEVYLAGLTLAIVASLETLLNLKAVDELDRFGRASPGNRELIAQGTGNLVSGLIGGLPVTSVIVRSSANVNAGARSRWSAIIHGGLLLCSVCLIPNYLNLIPMSALAAILLTTGFKLASPTVFKEMFRHGRYQMVPFLVTLIAIVVTDLLKGVLIGLATSVAFILNSNIRRPVRRFEEKHLSGKITRIELANQVSFLNRVALERVLRDVPAGGQVLLDAQATDYIDPDVLGFIKDFRDRIAPTKDVRVSLIGFRDKYQIQDELLFVDHTTRELRDQLTPERVLKIFKDGNDRFLSGRRLTRDLGRQVQSTASEQHPMAVVLSCIDSRSPVELILDLGLGDVFVVRVAGNVTSPKVLGSIEYATAVAGAKLILVLGHTGCGAVNASVQLACSGQSAKEATGCQFLEPIVRDIQQSLDAKSIEIGSRLTGLPFAEFVDGIAKKNVLRSVDFLVKESDAIRRLLEEGRIAVVGAMYDIATGKIYFMTDDARGISTNVDLESSMTLPPRRA
jgi:carbonic anhydrase/SulP family sulfate permease